MKQELFESVSDNLAKHEGRVLSMYLDSVGVVTCGVGHALFCAADAAKLVWWKDTSTLATREEVIREWEWVKRRQLKRGKLMMTYEESQQLLEADLKRFEVVVNNTFPDMDKYPLSVGVAVYDIAFNTGSLSDWPKLTAAVKAKEWKTAAAESNRPQVGKERNDDTFNQLALAA